MSRCYPYPPPGYEKKPHVELGLSPKKDKHKHKDKNKDKNKDKDKDKKKKRKRDSETNGDSSRRDKDKRSKKSQAYGSIEEGIHLTNGKLLDTKSAVFYAVEHDETTTLQISQTDVSGGKVLLDGGVVSLHRSSEHDSILGPSLTLISPKVASEPDSKIKSQLPLISTKLMSNGSITPSNDVLALTKTACQEVEDELSFQRQAQAALVEREKVWCAIDDQEWLFLCNPRDQKNVILEQVETPEAWAEAVYLPSVCIHALPYVVPD